MGYVVEIKCGQVFLKSTKGTDMLKKNCQKSWKQKLFLMKQHNDDIQEHSILKFGQCVYTIKKLIELPEVFAGGKNTILS